MNTAIIVAAGSGKRFGGNIPKQFLAANGKAILVHTLERFENCDLVDQIILVLADKEKNRFEKELRNYRIDKLTKIVSGGKTRAESVFNGLRAINSKVVDKDIVSVHDGARPLVTVDEISATIEAATKYGAACLVGQVTDTIKIISDNKIEKTIDRGILRRALTPQSFQFNILWNAFNQNEIDEITTDECYLVEQIGQEIALVEGSSKNIKITHDEDLKLAELYLKGIN